MCVKNRKKTFSPTLLTLEDLLQPRPLALSYLQHFLASPCTDLGVSLEPALFSRAPGPASDKLFHMVAPFVLTVLGFTTSH